MGDALHRRGRPLLGTFVEIAVAPGADVGGADRADRAVSAAFAAIETVHGLLSFQDPASDLSRLNGAAGGWVKLDPLTLRAIGLARAMTRLSGGLFNCTVGGALVERGVLPDHDLSVGLLSGVAEDIEVKPGAARLARPVRLTLDGLAKGLAVDLAVARLRRAGITHGLVEAGGDLRVFGDIPTPVHRREVDGGLTLLGHLTNGAVATSRVGGDPDPDQPGWIVAADGVAAKPGLYSVLARMAWRADALTKVAATAAVDDRDEAVTRLRGRRVLSDNEAAA
ncbi:MAG: FAD:protein FMN transferase [Caulobacter sp.]|nr:FAD:protein FMN transferase [Caulobacter sp.]